MGERLGASGGGPYISRSNAKLSLLKTKEKEEYIDFKLYINHIIEWVCIGPEFMLLWEI